MSLRQISRVLHSQKIFAPSFSEPPGRSENLLKMTKAIFLRKRWNINGFRPKNQKYKTFEQSIDATGAACYHNNRQSERRTARARHTDDRDGINI